MNNTPFNSWAFGDSEDEDNPFGLTPDPDDAPPESDDEDDDTPLDETFLEEAKRLEEEDKQSIEEWQEEYKKLQEKKKEQEERIEASQAWVNRKRKKDKDRDIPKVSLVEQMLMGLNMPLHKAAFLGLKESEFRRKGYDPKESLRMAEEEYEKRLSSHQAIRKEIKSILGKTKLPPLSRGLKKQISEKSRQRRKERRRV